MIFAFSGASVKTGASEEVVNAAQVWRSLVTAPSGVMKLDAAQCPFLPPFGVASGQNNLEGKLSGHWGIRRRGEGVHASSTRVTYVLMVYFEAPDTWH